MLARNLLGKAPAEIFFSKFAIRRPQVGVRGPGLRPREVGDALSAMPRRLTGRQGGLTAAPVHFTGPTWGLARHRCTLPSHRGLAGHREAIYRGAGECSAAG